MTRSRNGPDPRTPTGPDLDLSFDPDFVDPVRADEWFKILDGTIPWRQESIRLFGRTVLVPRLQSWHGDPGSTYRYSGLLLEPVAWTPLLAAIRTEVEQVVGGAPFDSVLVNLYRDGEDSMGWHSDDEPELGAEPEIASVSLGATRTFQLRHRTRRDLDRIDLDLTPGSLLVMRGKTQECWQHALPKRRGKRAPGPRINLTFRRILRAPR